MDAKDRSMLPQQPSSVLCHLSVRVNKVDLIIRSCKRIIVSDATNNALHNTRNSQNDVIQSNFVVTDRIESSSINVMSGNMVVIGSVEMLSNTQYRKLSISKFIYLNTTYQDISFTTWRTKTIKLIY